MFAELLGGIKAEKRHIAFCRTDNLTANTPLLDSNQILQRKGLGNRKGGYCSFHPNLRDGQSSCNILQPASLILQRSQIPIFDAEQKEGTKSVHKEAYLDVCSRMSECFGLPAQDEQKTEGKNIPEEV